MKKRTVYGKPNEAQKRMVRSGTMGMNKGGLRAAMQIARQRRFTYERQGPRCMMCGGPRESTLGLRCDDCQ